MVQMIGYWALATGTTRYPLASELIAASSLGDNELVAAVPGKKIVILSILLVASAAVTAKLKSGTTDITGDMSLAASGGFSAESRYGLLGTSAGEALNLNLSAAASVGGCLTYVEL